MYSKHKSGVLAELKAAEFFTKEGYTVFFPISSFSTVDLVVIKDKEILRVQVKNAYYMERPTGASYIQVTTRRNSSDYVYTNYHEDDFDILVVIYEDRIWIFPSEDVVHMQSIILDKGQQIRRSGKFNFDASIYEVR